MKVTKKEGKHGINKIFEYDNGIKCAAYASNSGYSINVDGEYICNLSEGEVESVCIGGNAVVKCGGDVSTYFQEIKENKGYNDCTTNDGKYTFSISNKKSAGGVIAYGKDNDKKTTSRLCSIIRCNTSEETETAIHTAKKICKEACEEYNETGKFKAYKHCSLEHSYSEQIEESIQLKFDATAEERKYLSLESEFNNLQQKYAALQSSYAELQNENKELKLKTHEHSILLDMYRYDKAEEDSTCPICKKGKLERLYSDRNHSLFIGCPNCREYSRPYSDRDKKLYEEGYIRDKWIENNLREEF